MRGGQAFARNTVDDLGKRTSFGILDVEALGSCRIALLHSHDRPRHAFSRVDAVVLHKCRRKVNCVPFDHSLLGLIRLAGLERQRVAKGWVTGITGEGRRGYHDGQKRTKRRAEHLTLRWHGCKIGWGFFNDLQ